MTFTLRTLEDGHGNELQVGNSNNSLLSRIILSAALTVEQAQTGKIRIVVLLGKVLVIDQIVGCIRWVASSVHLDLFVGKERKEGLKGDENRKEEVQCEIIGGLVAEV